MWPATPTALAPGTPPASPSSWTATEISPGLPPRADRAWTIGRLAPKWLALGGGGYDLQAVARAWTLAYGVMSEQELPDELPSSYRDQYQVAGLSDLDELPIEDSVRGDARQFAESSVEAVQRLIFPAHGLRSP